MSHKLFKKFHRIENNEYYYAEINGEIYYAVGTLYKYALQVFKKWRVVRTDEQSFVSVKLPEPILHIMSKIHSEPKDKALRHIRIESLEHLIRVTSELEASLIEQYPDKEQELKRQFRSKYENAYNSYELSWENPLITDSIEKKGWTFLCTIYTGLASREIWLGRRYDDMFVLHGYKLFGSKESNELMGMSRVMMNDVLLAKFLEQVTGVEQTVTESEKND